MGSWGLNLTEAPQHIVDLLLDGRYGHIAIDAARENPELLGDELLATARFVGPLLGASHEAGQVALRGPGMAFWLGAGDGLGDGFETTKSFVAAPFADVITQLLPAGGSVLAGAITTPSGAVPYTGSHRYQTPRAAIDYVCDLLGCDWRVRGDGRLDAGNNLFVTDPKAAVIRRAEGLDMGLRALPGAARLESDVEDFSTRVVTLAEGNGTTIQVGTANIAINPYVDLHGGPVKLTRFVSESNTSRTNADARAQIALDQYTTPREQLTLSSDTHDIRGDVEPGDRVWVHDPDAGLFDNTQEIVFRGDRINPVLLRVFQISWPIEAGMGVYFRTPAGVWHDLTDYVAWEDGPTNLTVGGYDRPLTSTSEPIGWRPNLDADTSVPGVPAFTLPLGQSIATYPDGRPRAELRVKWSGPALNTDGTAFVDGAHYEIRYRIAGTTSSTWAQAAALTWAGLGTWANPVPLPAGDWAIAYAAIDSGAYLLQDLTPGTRYELQIRALDSANPPNAGAWSASHFEQLGVDNVAPLPPAAPIVAGSLVQISVRHNLGLASGGTFNLATDLAYLEVHVGASETFTPDDTTRVGKIIATAAQINGSIPVIGSFPVSAPSGLWTRVIAVDQAGNHSDPSAASAVTVELIDSQWVSDLTADKITAGSFTASYGLVGLFTAGTPGAARFEAGVNGALNGFRLYRPSGTLALHGDATTGNLSLLGTNGTTETLRFTAATGLVEMRGRLTAGTSFTSGDRIVIDPDYVQIGGGEFPTITLYSAAGTRGPARINATDQPTSGTGHTSLGLNSGPTSSSATYEQTTLFLWPTAAYLSVNSGGGGVGPSRRGGTLAITKTEAKLTFSPSGVDRSHVLADTSGAVIAGTNTSGATTSYVEASAAGTVEMSAGGGVYAYGGGASKVELRNDGSALFGGNGNGYVSVSAGGATQLVSNSTVIASTALANYWNSGGSKTFVIDHPVRPDGQFLVHACIEGPTADLLYRGEAVVQGGRKVIELPGYFEAASRADGRQVQVTPVGEPYPVAASEIEGGRFTIRCDAPDGTRVKWLVTAIRADVTPFEVEPRRDSVRLGGFGPYRFITPTAA